MSLDLKFLCSLCLGHLHQGQPSPGTIFTRVHLHQGPPSPEATFTRGHLHQGPTSPGPYNSSVYHSIFGNPLNRGITVYSYLLHIFYSYITQFEITCSNYQSHHGLSRLLILILLMWVIAYRIINNGVQPTHYPLIHTKWFLIRCGYVVYTRNSWDVEVRVRK